MNERIKEFAKQTLSKDQWGLWLAGDKDIEKFVELIVRECAEICLEANDYKNILQHFGVEQ
jgi:hypothetical protein